MPARLHPRTGKPLYPIGVWRGRLVWPVMGASELAPEPTPEPPAPEPTPEPVEDKTDWKSEARKWEQRAKENRDKATKLDDLEAANATELDKATKRAEEAEGKASAATARALKAEIRSLADGFADRHDAVLRLADSEGGLERFLDESGEIDSKAITRELKDVLKDKPHLAAVAEDADKDKGSTSRPVEKLRPGAAPAADKREAAPTLAGAVQAHYQQ